MRLEPVRLRDAESQLDRALVAAGAAAGLAIAVVDHRGRPWASATFTGTQHALVLAAARAPALGGWAAALPDAELPLHGHLVASLAVERIEDDGATVRLELTVVTLEEWGAPA